MKMHSTYSKWNMFCFRETVMLRTEQFPILWTNCLLQSSFCGCKHCTWVYLAKFTDGGKEGWLLNKRNSCTMHCAKLCPSFLNFITHCCVYRIISAATKCWCTCVLSVIIQELCWCRLCWSDLIVQSLLSLPVVRSSLKPLPCAVLRWFCSVVCSWGSVHALVSCMSHGKVCLCRGGCSSGLCLLVDHATASLIMVVTLQVPCVMSYLEEIINQVNDWQVNYSQHSECTSLLEAPAGIQVLRKPGPQLYSAFSFSQWALYNLPHSSHMHLHSPTEMINPQLEELF